MVGKTVKLLQRSIVLPAERASVAQAHCVGNLAGRDGFVRSGVLAFNDRDFLSQIREMKSMGILLFACSAALADAERVHRRSYPRCGWRSWSDGATRGRDGG